MCFSPQVAQDKSVFCQRHLTPSSSALRFQQIQFHARDFTANFTAVLLERSRHQFFTSGRVCFSCRREITSWRLFRRPTAMSEEGEALFVLLSAVWVSYLVSTLQIFRRKKKKRVSDNSFIVEEETLCVGEKKVCCTRVKSWLHFQEKKVHFKHDGLLSSQNLLYIFEKKSCDLIQNSWKYTIISEKYLLFLVYIFEK